MSLSRSLRSPNSVLSGNDTAGQFCLIDMYVPPEGGPPPHRHDFEETFVNLGGEVEAAFRGEKRTLQAGQTIHIPANAPHQFHNASSKPARMLCICSPAGQEEFFKEMASRGYTHDSAAQTRGCRTSRIHEKSSRAGAQIPNRTAERSRLNNVALRRSSSLGMASRNCCSAHSAVGCAVRLECRIRRLPTSITTRT